MADYTPDTETVREQYTREQPAHIGTVAEKAAEFDRWLALERAEAGARALEDAAEWLDKDELAIAHVFADGLRERAARLRGGETP